MASVEVDQSPPLPLPPSAAALPMAAVPNLSSGALRAIHSDQKLDFFPVLQVLHFKKVANEGGAVRYRVLISDGINFQLVVSSTSLTAQIEAELKKTCVIELTGYNISNTKNKRILIISGFQVLHGPVAKIGEPVNLDQGAGGDEGMEGGDSRHQAAPAAASPAAEAPPPPQTRPSPPVVPQQAPPPPAARPAQQPRQPPMAAARPAPQPAPRPTPQQQQQHQPQARPPPMGQQQHQQRPAFNLPQQGAAARPQRPPPSSSSSSFQRQEGSGSFQRGQQPPAGARPNARPVQHPPADQQPGAGFGAPVHTFPIANLNPYQHRWVIKARITSKSDIKEWKNSRGEGRLFSFDLLDQSGEIRAVGFNDAVEKFYNHLHVGGVYYISRANIRTSNGKFNNTKSNYEMQIDQNTEIHPCDNDAPEIPTANFAFVPISEIERLEKDSTIDIIAVVMEGSDYSIVSTKNGETPRRNLVVMDGTGASIKLTIWGKAAEGFDWADYPIYGIKSVRVSDYGGRTLSSSGSTFLKNPDIRETHELRAWFEGVGGPAYVPRSLTVGGPSGGSLSSLPSKTISQVRDEGLGQQEGQMDDFLLKAYILNIPKDGNIAYPACPTEKCNRKVLEEGENQWSCAHCQATFGHCCYRYTLSLSLADFTGQLWVRSFDNVGAIVISQPADRAVELRNVQYQEYESLIQGAFFKQYTFKVRAKLDKYEDNIKTTFMAQAAWPVDYLKDSRRLLKAIAEFS